MSFKLNPIRVSDNSKIVRIVESKMTLEEDITAIKITTLTNIPIVSYDIDENLMIDLDIKLLEVKLSYYKNEICVGYEFVELVDKSEYKKNLSEDEILYLDIKNNIKNIMDRPQGTETEKSAHTSLLKNAIIDYNARIYIMSKIRKELYRSDKVPENEIEDYVYRLYSDLYGLGVLQALDDDPSVGEIMVNARTFPKFICDIYIVKNQIKVRYDKSFESQPEMENVFRKLIEFDKKELNSTDKAEVEATRPNGDRVNIIIPDASNNWILNMRKFSNFVPEKEMMRQSGTIDDYNENLFNILISGLANIGIGGYMGTGKTTLINYLLTFTDPITRKVIISSVPETDIDRVLKGHDIVILNVNDDKHFTFAKHLKFALRTTADRIIVPESRGEEFKQIYESNLKTSGNIFTAHALDDDAFLDMCTEMYKSSPSAQGEDSIYVKSKLAKSINIIVIMRKVGNKIRIKSISEVITENGKFKELVKLQQWKFNPENPLEGKYEATGNKISDALRTKLNENGIPLSLMKDL